MDNRMSSDEERIQEKERDARALREKREILEREAERWRKQRDRLNESVKALRDKALIERDERDRINGQVAEVKEDIRNLFAEMDGKRNRLALIEMELESESRRLPSRDKIEKSLRSIEWELMTTPTLEMKGRESSLIDEADSLRKALAEHRKLEALFDRRLDSMADSKAVELGLRERREEIRRLHEMSQEHHEAMILLFRKVDEERKLADEAHGNFIENISELRAVDKELGRLNAEIRGIDLDQRERDGALRAQRRRVLNAKRQELQEAAKIKLEKGQKLSFEELKLLYEDEEEDEEE
jgi:uncharacterized coiled-coil DUF342 family protein